LKVKKTLRGKSAGSSAEGAAEQRKGQRDKKDAAP
jgi:hypothetical protein